MATSERDLKISWKLFAKLQQASSNFWGLGLKKKHLSVLELFACYGARILQRKSRENLLFLFLIDF